jgi:hypothetical protein
MNNNLEFHVTGTFRSGRFCCYDYSQSKTQFQFPIPGVFNAVGSGCQGSNGTPYMFSPVLPWVGDSLPIIVANLPPNAPAIMLFGSSNSSWGGLPLPANLATFGAPGCTIYASGDILQPVTNYNGTAYHVLNLPPSLVPGANFYLQGVTIDPAANALGVTVSNGLQGTLGIH